LGIAANVVSSYLAFSPLPRIASGRLFSVALSVTLADAFPLGSMALFVVRTFLYQYKSAATERPSFFKAQKYDFSNINKFTIFVPLKNNRIILNKFIIN